MANREALRELQARLARRLQAARAEGVSVSWLAVVAGGLNYLFPLAQSGEIFPLGPVQPVPYVKPWFRGVTNLRGGLFGVADLASLVSGGPVAVRSEQSLADACVVTLNATMEVNCALLVDALAGLRNPDAFSGFEPPAPDAPAYFGNTYTDSAGHLWQEINLLAIARMPQFLNISA